jgi:D-sedoheptulose 7-phosphate isomerase
MAEMPDMPEPKWVIADYLRAFGNVLSQIEPDAVERVLGCLHAAREKGAMVFVAGNGGSAATGSHWVNDLCKAAKGGGRKAMRAMSLSDNVSWLTALANDEGYERVFSGQLENFAAPGDLLVVMSASGNSPNLVQAVELARKLGVLTIGFLGFDGGALKNTVDAFIWVPSERGAYGLVESAHALLCHLLTHCLTMGLDVSQRHAQEKVRSAAVVGAEAE